MLRSVKESGVGFGNFGEVGAGVGHFTSDSATCYVGLFNKQQK